MELDYKEEVADDEDDYNAKGVSDEDESESEEKLAEDGL
jgi:hypothetical protein